MPVGVAAAKLEVVERRHPAAPNVLLPQEDETVMSHLPMAEPPHLFFRMLKQATRPGWFRRVDRS